MSLLDVQNLSVHYGTDRGVVRAVDDVALRIAGPGETLGVIGESGSGKSTLALALMRLLPRNAVHVAGTIRVDDDDVHTWPDDRFRREVRWRRLSMVFQGAMNSLNPVIRVGRQVTERPLLDGIPAAEAYAEVERLFDLVGLPRGTAGRYPHELSGGMKQRVAVAMALALRPDLVILDEPTSALDVSVQAQMMNLFKRLKADLGLAMLFITHDIALASDLADRVLVMKGGRVQETGGADDVLTNPHHPYTQTLLASVPRLRAVRASAGRETPGADLVQIDALDVSFQTRRGWLRTTPSPAVDGVSLVLRSGGTVALVGESGCGKTTLGKATLRLVPASGGRVLFDGADIRALRGRALKSFRRRAQLIPQDPYASISPYMRVEQVVEEPLLVHGNGNRATRSHTVADALEAVGLPADITRAYPHTLSGGQRQRVVVARALTLDPDYLVADEPVSMIDASARGDILALLRRLQQQRDMAMLLITHDIASAGQVADRVVVMYRGRVVEDGPAARVIAEPLHPYTRALIDAVPEPDPANRHRLRSVVEGEFRAAMQATDADYQQLAAASRQFAQNLQQADATIRYGG
jgi:peptide/nickel transport system ATP-binding protein